MAPKRKAASVDNGDTGCVVLRTRTARARVGGRGEGARRPARPAITRGGHRACGAPGARGHSTSVWSGTGPGRGPSCEWRRRGAPAVLMGRRGDTCLSAPSRVRFNGVACEPAAESGGSHACARVLAPAGQRMCTPTPDGVRPEHVDACRALRCPPGACSFACHPVPDPLRPRGIEDTFRDRMLGCTALIAVLEPLHPRACPALFLLVGPNVLVQSHAVHMLTWYGSGGGRSAKGKADLSYVLRSYILYIRLYLIIYQIIPNNLVVGKGDLPRAKPISRTCSDYMCMYVRMYVRMYICMYVCMCVCMFVCMYVWIHVWIYVCICVCICVYLCMYV